MKNCLNRQKWAVITVIKLVNALRILHSGQI